MLRARQCQLECDRSDSAPGSQASYHSQKQQQDRSVLGKKGKLMQRLTSLWNTPVFHDTFAKQDEQDKCEEELEDASVINGPAADLWSLGIVLYEMVSISLSALRSLALPVVHCVASTHQRQHEITLLFLLCCVLPAAVFAYLDQKHDEA